MGNFNDSMLEQGDNRYASALFHDMDVNHNGYLTLKDLMDTRSPAYKLPHSLPALYFFDEKKDGRLTVEEFTALVDYCHTEKRKVEQELLRDKSLRDLILRASQAGVKDCSVHGRTSYRRLSSYAKVWSVFSTPHDEPDPSINGEPPPPCEPPATDPPPPQTCEQNENPPNTSSHSTCSSDASSLNEEEQEHEHEHQTENNDTVAPNNHDTTKSNSEHDENSENDEHDENVENDERNEHEEHDEQKPCTQSVHTPCGVAMYSSQRQAELNHYITGCETTTSSSTPDNECSSTDDDLLNPQNRTAIDVAVLENVVSASIHKLADLLHGDGSRGLFMDWLWALVDFNSSGVVTLEELRVFLAALSEDGIDLEELVFRKEGNEPLEVCIINEFDTTHAGLLSRDEFMVLADLVTKEYEFWENRHLDRIGDYELGRTIGRGSSGVVRLAFHVEKRQRFAIKIIKKGKCSDLSRLDREIQSLMSAKHKHIVALEQVLESETNIFIVMELCGGGSMIDIVRLYPEERMPEETARFFMRQVFQALEFCHSRGICHRDVRLENFMLDNAGNVKITDFGHSGMYQPNWDLFSTLLVGSVHNLSPEQIRAQVYSGEKIDIWSAGVAIYCLLIGHPPFMNPDVNMLMKDIVNCSYSIPDFVSENAADLIRCMIRETPEDRTSFHQLLQHPWFSDGPEYGPSMNVVVFPVDRFYVKRPDLAEMIFAMTIYQHNLHFHLGDTHHPKSTPDEFQGQDWTLKCLCPRNDIKFAVSLFTKPPTDGSAGTDGREEQGMSPAASEAELSLLPASIETADGDQSQTCPPDSSTSARDNPPLPQLQPFVDVRLQDGEDGPCTPTSTPTQDNYPLPGLQPFIEVRLQNGEAGLFLKICRKLKRICSSKLGEVAQRRKHLQIGERRSLTTLKEIRNRK